MSSKEHISKANNNNHTTSQSNLKAKPTFQIQVNKTKKDGKICTPSRLSFR